MSLATLGMISNVAESFSADESLGIFRRMCRTRYFELKVLKAYNVGLSDANLSKWELCKEIKKRVPDFYFVEAKVGEDPDKRNYIVSNAKIEVTGFKPDVSLQMGIAELVKGYQIIRKSQFTNV